MLSDFLNKTLSGACEQEHATPLYFCHDVFIHRPVAQLVEHRVVLREVVSSTPAGPTLMVFVITSANG